MNHRFQTNGCQIKTIHGQSFPSQTKPEMAAYYHKICFSPTKNHSLQAIKDGAFQTWPGLTLDLIRKHLPKLESTSLGHLHQQKTKLRSTRNNPPQHTPEEEVAVSAKRTHDVFYTTQTSGQIFTDQTGRFPI